MKRIYFDYAASTPVDNKVQAKMKPYFSKNFGNPHALHYFGQVASKAVFESRQTIAEAIGAHYREIIFTGSATEANNLAIKGVAKAFKANNPSKKFKIITTAFEHESVLETCRDLEREGAEVVYIPVSKDGIVDVKKLEAALDDKTILVTVMHANNEIGTIQPISEIAKVIQKFKDPDSRYPLLHTDAVQSFQYLDCDIAKLGVDLMTLSAHKIYGPKGIGTLYVKRDLINGRQRLIAPLITGSGQEQGLRSGTDNVPYIVGFAKAAELAVTMRVKESKRMKGLSDYFYKSLKKTLPSSSVNGSLTDRLPNNLNIYFPQNKSQELLIKLDLAGIAASPGAACSSRVAAGSYVLEAMGLPEERCIGSIRFSLGRQTTKADVSRAVRQIKKILT